MYSTGTSIIEWLEQFAPVRYAVAGDKIGLQIGTLHKKIQKLLIALDVTDAVVDEAIRERVELIIAHHAVIFRPLAHIQTDTPAGKLYEKLIKHDIAVYIAHTNLDITQGGINDMMAVAIGLPAELEPLEPLDGVDRNIGLGRAGRLPKPYKLRDFAQHVKTRLQMPAVRVVGDLDRQVAKAAVLGGSGGKYVEHAIRSNADVYITGDIDYHTAQDALAAGLAIIDIGHNAEKIMKTTLAKLIQQWIADRGSQTVVLASEVNTEPFQFC